MREGGRPLPMVIRCHRYREFSLVGKRYLGKDKRFRWLFFISSSTTSPPMILL